VIPQALSLTNFMCYQRMEVDFTGIHVACLSGDNGAGKSALLDAMTWSLWGKARARRDDELIRLGQDEMAVDFTFQLGGDRYRVLRQRKAGKRGRSSLDFQIRDAGGWRSIGEGSIRATQAKIEHVLRLDYDTFVNSAFLRQGHADEFTVKTPAERKRVLGEILGLDVWDTYEERVKERQRSVEREAHALNLRLKEIEAELARRPEYEAQVETAQQEVVELSAALQEIQTAWQALEATRADLRLVRSQRQEVARRIEQAEQEVAGLGEEQARRKARLDQHQRVLAQAEEIEAGFAAYQEALEQERTLGEKLAELADLNEERRALEAEISEARHALETKRELAAQQVADLEARRPTPELRAEHEALQAQTTHLRQLEESREAAQADLAQLSERQAALLAENKTLLPEMEALKERIERLERAGADCPLCGQPLSDADRRRLVAELQAEGKQRGDAYRANKARHEALSQEALDLQKQIDETAPLLKDLPPLERRLTLVTEQVRAGEEAEQALGAAREALAQVEATLAAESYAPDARSALATVLTQAAELGYDAEAYEAARQAVSDGRAFAEQKAQLDAARAGSEQEEAALAKVAASMERWQKQIAADRARDSELAAKGAELEESLETAAAVEQELNRVRAAEAEARQRLGAAQQRLAACDALVQQKERRVERREELDHLAGLYDELRTAFGVHGVPAMIIEAAVPEIESEANRLLNRMTNGRMHVRLDTQRETLAGTVRETLDIHIMDELGERPYDNFSGGEKFRINFALRIALSRLLARRAGAELQTLIVDEGFGTQDAQGRERLVEAIHAVQDEFTRILVITHIEELQDAFPVRIHVTKTPEGSVIELL
jgi:exonuclease SbcC